MAVTTVFFNDYKEKILNGNAPDLDTDTIKVALCTSSYTPSIDNHDYFNDITNEVVATGYTAGGATLASKAVVQDNTNDKATFDAADVTWATSTITARYAIIYKSTGTASTSQLIAYVDFGADKSSDGDNFIISWDATNLIFGLS